MTVFAMTVMSIVLVNHFKDLWMNSKVFPIVSLTLTPLIVLHVFTLDVKMVLVVRLFMKRLFEIITCDLFDVKSHMTGIKLQRPSFLVAGYEFVSLTNNMGISFWFLVVFLASLFIKLGLYIFESKVLEATKSDFNNQKLSKYLRI